MKHFNPTRTAARMAAIGLAAMAVSLAVTPAASAKELIYSLIAPGHPLNEPIFGTWSDQVAKATDGRVTIKILDTAAAPGPRLYDAIRTGIVDAGHTFIGFLAQKSPLIQLSMLPMIAPSAEANAVALARTYEKYFAAKETLDGVKVIGFLSNPQGIMCSLKQPIDSTAALQSLKMWSLPGYAAKAMEAAGAPVVAGPATEMFALVSKGTVDGFNGISIGDAFAFKVDKFAKSCTTVKGGVFTAVFAVMVNQSVWDSLSAEDQKAIESVSNEAFAHLSGASDDWNAKMMQAYKDGGGMIVVPSDAFQADLKAKWQPMHQAWIDMATAAGLNGQEVYDYYVAQVADASK
jgi:TRAP-type C4-dicarboxylate transport system substrate-binding protein